MRCHQCGAESPLTTMFVRKTKSFRRDPQLFCPQCIRSDKDFAIALVLAAAALVCLVSFVDWVIRSARGNGLGSADGGWGSGWEFASTWSLFLLFQIICIVPHELGHTVAGRLLGFDVWRIRLGRGRLLARWQIGGVLVEVAALPVVGFVNAVSGDKRRWRWRRVGFIAAGPLANIVIMVMAVGIAFQLALDRRAWAWMAWMVLAAANFVMVLQSLLGRHADIGGKKVPTDGRQLWRLLFKPLPKPEVRRLEYFHSMMEALMAFNHHREVVVVTQEGLLEFPLDIALSSSLGLAQLAIHDFVSGRDTFKALLERHAEPSAMRAICLNNLAWADLSVGEPALIKEADSLSAEAYGLLPWVPAINGTRGFALIESGQIDTGITLLRFAYKGADGWSSKASVLCCLAIAHARLGENAAAESFLRKAARFDPNCDLMSRARRAMQGEVAGTVQAANA
jgi:Zn-dependent protease